jgi:calcium-dependent protein kinase
VDGDIQQSIQKNLIRFVELNPFQKLVLSLMAGLNASNDELHHMQKEFLRLDKNKTGTLKIEDIKKIAESDIGRIYSRFSEHDWEEILRGCDLNDDGVIDFQDFICACVDRRTLVKEDEVKKAFQIIDTNKDGVLCLEDF